MGANNLTTTQRKKLGKYGNLGGRPTKYSEDAVKKLESIFQVGGTVEEATSYAGISKQTYYDWLERNEGLLAKMEAAKHYADVVAKNVVVDAIVEKKDIATAKWWLEKRQFKDTNQTNVQINIPTFNVMSQEAKDQLEKLYERPDSSDN